ncbi:MAG: shikimate dehydrogenase [Oscillospiraceae bacterium]
MQLRKFAVIGHPIGHTMSPYIHQRLFALQGIFPEYAAFDLQKLGGDFLRSFDGINVTIPYKRQILSCLDEIDPMALRVGSVNTIKITKGKMRGYTTDGVGCLKSLRHHGIETRGKILLLGNGGAARAIAFALFDDGATPELTIAARSRERGEELKKSLNRENIRVLTCSELLEEKTVYSLVVNATSVGMYPDISVSPVPKSVLERCQTLFDAVYNPRETLFLKMGRELSKNCIPGMEMLVFQGVCAHEIWYDARFSPQDLHTLCRDAAIETEKLFAKRD